MTPIIFVPGIMGSRLRLPRLNDSGLDLDWDPDDKLGMHSLTIIDLETRIRHLSISSRPFVQPKTAFSSALTSAVSNPLLQAIAAMVQNTVQGLYGSRGWPGVAWSFYGDLLVALETKYNFGIPLLAVVNHPVYAFAYDWRLSNADNGVKLRAFIAKICADHQADQVAIVTHSMGGLVTRSACQDQATSAKVCGVVHVAQPANGSVLMYRRCLTGYQPPALDDDSFFVSMFFKGLFGTSNQSYIALASGLPSALELLPNHRYSIGQPQPWLTSTTPLDLSDIYTVYKQQQAPGIVAPGLLMTVPGFSGLLLQAELQMRIDAARVFHQILGEFVHPNTHVIHSTGLTTDESVTVGGSIQVSHPLRGDHTVHESSASMANFGTTSIKGRTALTGLEHGEMFKANGLFPSAATNAVTAALDLFLTP